CTVGNFGPGFDVLSLALERVGDSVQLREAEADEVTMTGPGAERIPREWTRNAACAAIDHLRAKTGKRAPLHLALTKGMPPGSGLGSSASSSAAAVRAFVQLHDISINAATALDAAAAGEAVASGGAHRDDVGAALFGGLVIVGGDGPDTIIRLRPPPIHLVVARPDVELATREMRGLIPQALPRADVVHNLSNVARIVHACHMQDAAMLCRALDDRISRPYRAPRVPRYDEMRDAAMHAGASAFLLSGSGPAVIAACVPACDPAPVADALRVLIEKGEVFVTRPGGEVDSPGIRLH
ncbi:MAG: homoserine kinase, partial [Candidatus Thermoplasmatota archaeon]